MVGVLEMNKSIFGSTFVEKKASRRARKAMAMDLMVPSNAVELTSEEMEYIDGGSTTTYSGLEAWAYIFVMLASAVGCYLTATKLAAVAAAATSTVIGAIVGVLAGVGCVISLAGAGESVTQALLGITLLLANGKFTVNSWSIWTVSFFVITG